MTIQDLIGKWGQGGLHDTIHIEPQSYATARMDIEILAAMLKLAIEGLRNNCVSRSMMNPCGCRPCAVLREIEALAGKTP